MKMKKVLKTMIVAVSIFGLVGTANAAPDQCDCAINLYGASAQYKFWTSASPGLLQSWGCAVGDTYQADGDPTGDRDNGIAICAGGTPVGDPTVTGAGMPGVGGGGTFCLRYTSFASAAGIRAVSNQNPNSVDQPPCTAGCVDFQPGCSTPPEGYRQLADEMQTTFAAYPGMGSVDGLACRDVHIGASDVGAACFGQDSQGELKGPCGGGDFTSSVSGLAAELCPGNRFDNPVVVPFAFFKNDNPENPVPFDNINSVMIAAIATGAAQRWEDFDPDLAANPMIIKLCMRHAGSGTQATLQGMMNAYQGGAGSLMITDERGPSHPLVVMNLSPIVYFNKGSSDMMYCIGGKCKDGSYHDAIGAIGYADADKVTSYTHGEEGKYGYVQRMLWEGFGCVSGACDDPALVGSGAIDGPTYDTENIYKDAITHGRYTFWADQHLYNCPWDTGGIDPTCYPDCGTATDWIANMTSYASVPANLPASRANFWAAQNEMEVSRADCNSCQKHD